MTLVNKLLLLAVVAGVGFLLLKKLSPMAVRAGEAPSALLSELSALAEVQEDFDFASI